MSVAQGEALTSTAAYAKLFAQHLLNTRPRTQEHLNALDTYVLATVATAQEAAPKLKASELNTDYLRRLSEAVGVIGATVLVPPVDWDYQEWNRWGRIGRASLVVPRGFEATAWSDVFAGIVSGHIAVKDERRYQLFSAFVRRG